MPNPDYRNSNSEVEGLVDRAAHGDAEAFGYLYDTYAERIYRHIYYRTSSSEDARDLTHDVFIEVWKALPRYKRTKTPFLGWLFTICRHTIIDYYRTKKDHAYLDDDIVLQDPGKGPEELAETHFTQKEIRRAILKLPDQQQQVLLLCFIEGFSYREAAATLNKSEGNIRVIVHRALKKMWNILGAAGR